MIKRISKIYFLILLGSLLTTSVLFGQRKYSVVVDDIIGLEPPGAFRTYEVKEDKFELSITSFENNFNMVMVDVIDQSLGRFPLSRYIYKLYNGEVFTDFYIGDLEFNKVYDLRVVYMIYDRPLIDKRIKIIRRL